MKLRNTGFIQNAVMSFKGIDDGTDTLKCAELITGNSTASGSEGESSSGGTKKSSAGFSSKENLLTCGIALFSLLLV